VVLSVLAGVALGSLTVGLLWPLTPNVGDAEARIATRLAGVHARDAHELPSPIGSARR
jgi:hypothetical protein